MEKDSENYQILLGLIWRTIDKPINQSMKS